MRYFIGLTVLICAVAYAGGFELARYLNAKPTLPAYHGAPVAGFTTGGMNCSPICGHDNQLTHN